MHFKGLKIPKTKCNLFCGTPCTCLASKVNIIELLFYHFIADSDLFSFAYIHNFSIEMLNVKCSIIFDHVVEMFAYSSILTIYYTANCS